MRGSQSEALMPAVATALAAAGLAVSRVERVICGAGPGSFTSLRIAAGIAKGIALGVGVPLYAVSSLGLALAGSSMPPGKYVVALDALRGEWYAAVYVRADDGAVSEAHPAVLVAGDGLAAYAESMNSELFKAGSGGADPHASGCVALAQSIERSGPVNLDSWEPAYGRLAEAQVKWEAVHGRSLRG